MAVTRALPLVCTIVCALYVGTARGFQSPYHLPLLSASRRGVCLWMAAPDARPFSLGRLVKGLFGGGLPTGNEGGWSGDRGVRRAELKEELAAAVAINQGR